MNTTFVPGPVDAKLQMENAITETASFSGTSLDLGSGFAAGGPGQKFSATIVPTALDLTSGNETYAAFVQESADGNTWVTISASVPITAIAVCAIPVFVSLRYVRVGLTLGGTTPSISCSTYLIPHQ